MKKKRLLIGFKNHGDQEPAYRQVQEFFDNRRDEDVPTDSIKNVPIDEIKSLPINEIKSVSSDGIKHIPIDEIKIVSTDGIKSSLPTYAIKSLMTDGIKCLVPMRLWMDQEFADEIKSWRPG
ncbi:hypothetical protein WA026_022406 [Henosepilachna vigintioctopunctata]|uniref:Uncharacterized protein n=1 Tax=Henosepilachna vigintioctopunctata TaxID=420089 RepID=A0AAW1UEI4_9CUCU